MGVVWLMRAAREDAEPSICIHRQSPKVPQGGTQVRAGGAMYWGTLNRYPVALLLRQPELALKLMATKADFFTQWETT